MEQPESDCLFHVHFRTDWNAVSLCDEKLSHTGRKAAESLDYYFLCIAAVHRRLCLDTAFGQKRIDHQTVKRAFRNGTGRNLWICRDCTGIFFADISSGISLCIRGFKKSGSVSAGGS